MEMALTGDRISSAQALEWGLVNRVVDDEDLERCKVFV
jgi:enoyl-CoA hydratase/carnithine racemase